MRVSRTSPTSPRTAKHDSPTRKEGFFFAFAKAITCYRAFRVFLSVRRMASPAFSVLILQVMSAPDRFWMLVRIPGSFSPVIRDSSIDRFISQCKQVAVSPQRPCDVTLLQSKASPIFSLAGLRSWRSNALRKWPFEQRTVWSPAMRATGESSDSR